MINSYFLPINYYEAFEDNVIEFLKAYDLYDDYGMGVIFIPNDFYDTFPDEIWKADTIEKERLINILSRGGVKCDYSHSILEIIASQSSERVGFVYINDCSNLTLYEISSDYFFSNEADEKKCLLNLLKLFKLNELKDYLPKYFKNLIFLDDSCSKINHLRRNETDGHTEDQIVGELLRHLSVLDSQAIPAYLESGCNSQSAIELINARGVICSGIGANENPQKYEKTGISNGVVYHNLKFIPHTKLFLPNTDQRIYFSWGRESDNPRKAIIGQIGGHWG